MVSLQQTDSSFQKAASYSLNEKQVSSFRFLMNSSLLFTKDLQYILQKIEK